LVDQDATYPHFQYGTLEGFRELICPRGVFVELRVDGIEYVLGYTAIEAVVDHVGVPRGEGGQVGFVGFNDSH
jgi:hypothetical protein